jgi:hypothetical protein
MPKSITLGDVFSDKQVRQLLNAYQKAEEAGELPHQALVKIIEPLMPQINQRTGQDKDAGYWAFAVEYVFSRGIK